MDPAGLYCYCCWNLLSLWWWSTLWELNIATEVTYKHLSCKWLPQSPHSSQVLHIHRAHCYRLTHPQGDGVTEGHETGKEPKIRTLKTSVLLSPSPSSDYTSSLHFCRSWRAVHFSTDSIVSYEIQSILKQDNYFHFFNINSMVEK